MARAPTATPGRLLLRRPVAASAAAWLLLAPLFGCDKGPSLSKTETATEESRFETPDLGAPSERHLLGALVDRAPIYAAASKKAPVLGYLHAGSQVPRSEKVHENDQCTEGWYQIAPLGYVCTEKSATTDLEHPTLKAMALGPRLDLPLPYVYARTTKVTAVYDKSDSGGVVLSGRLGRSTVLAVVGSWTAPDESLEPQRLGLKMDGRFVRADDLEAAPGSSFHGVDLTSGIELPFGFVVRRGIRAWKLDGGPPQKDRELAYHEKLRLTGRFRTIEGLRFWATENGLWVRHKDVTVVRRRHELPEFASDGQKWLDVSIVTGTLVAYEGTKPVFATLVSVGRDRLGDPETTASTARGTFRVLQKHITRRVSESADEALHDAPWALELESGQFLVASPRHDRFGIEHTDGDIEVSPADGAFLFRFATPELPAGWHGVTVDPAGPTLIVNVRK